MHRRLLVWPGVLAAALALAAALVACGGSSASSAAPSLQGTTLQGKAFDMAASGKPTVVNFFGWDCPPCNAEAPDLVAFATAHPEVQVIGVDVRNAQAETEKFVAEYRIPYTIVMDDGGISSAWGVDWIPHTFFVDRDGVIGASSVGALTRAQFEEKLKSIL